MDRFVPAPGPTNLPRPAEPNAGAGSSSELAPDPLAGTRYATVQRLGAGGMGEVFEAIHTGLGKRVVVKLLRQAVADNPHHHDRLRLEAQTLASIESPHLVSVTDIGTTPDGRPFFVMERLYGRTLHRVLAERGAIPPHEAIAWTLQILAGLAVAHRVGIIHRDVKLENVFLCDPTPEREALIKVLDFGVAKVLQSAGLPFDGPKYATEEGHLVGSPRYVSPEQIQFNPVDARTDVYAVGLVLYSLLAGRGPFAKTKRLLDLLQAHIHEVPEPPSKVAPQYLIPELDRVVLRAIAKDPKDRHPSAEVLAAELRSVLPLLPGLTQPLPHSAEPGAGASSPLTTARGTWIALPPAREPSIKEPQVLVYPGTTPADSSPKPESTLPTALPPNEAQADEALVAGGAFEPVRSRFWVIAASTSIVSAALFIALLRLFGVIR